MKKNAVAACAIIAGIAVVGVIITVIAAGWAVGPLFRMGQREYEETQRRESDQAALAREQIRQRQLELISSDLDEAAESAKAGEVDDALGKLRAVEEQLMIIARAAEQSADDIAAPKFEALRRQTENAISRVEAAPEGD